MGVGGYAIKTAPIDFTAADLDVSVTLKTTFSNGNQFISLYFSKALPSKAPSGADTFHVRFCLDGDNFGLNNTMLGDTAVGAYAGGYVAFGEDTAYTLRFKRVDGMIRMYINNELTYGPAGDTDQRVSDFIEGIGSGYLTIGTSSFDGGFTTTVLQVNGKAPLSTEVPRWITGEGVSTDAATGTFSMGAVNYAIRTAPIDFTAADLDVSVTLKTTFSNASQFISLYFSSSAL